MMIVGVRRSGGRLGGSIIGGEQVIDGRLVPRLDSLVDVLDVVVSALGLALFGRLAAEGGLGPGAYTRPLFSST